MEKVVEDLGECIKDAKTRLGYHRWCWPAERRWLLSGCTNSRPSTQPSVQPVGRTGPDLTALDPAAPTAIMRLAAPHQPARHGSPNGSTLPSSTNPIPPNVIRNWNL